MKNLLREDKKKLGNDARVNYQASNRSTIFDSKPEENTRDTKLRLNKDENRFEPKFQEMSSSSRKFREIHDAHANVEELKSKRTSSTFGHMKKENATRDEGVEKPHQLGDAWKRKLAELNPKLKEEDINEASQLKGTETFYNRRSLMNQDGPVTSHKDAKVKELQSNIFNDFTKNENPYPLEGKAVVNTKNHKMCDEESQHRVIVAGKPKVANISNSFKHLVKEAEPQYEKMTSVDDTYNAKQMKKMNLLSHMDAPTVKRAVVDTEVARAERMAKENSEKANVDVESLLFPESKTRISNLKQRAANANPNDGIAEEKEFKIIPSKGYNYVQNAEIKLLFAKSGIHIYDIKDTVKQQEDSRSGQIAFKVRNNTDISDFNYKLNLVTSKINKLGLTLKENIDHHTKKICDIVPADVKWNSTHVNTITDKRMEKTAATPPKQRLPANQRLANQLNYQDSKFKNSYHAPLFGITSSR